MTSRKPVEKSLKAFCENIVDYAGLFPPASLNLAQAFNNFVMYKQEEYSWMISRFVIPAGRLSELEEMMNQLKYSEDLVLGFSVLGSPSADVVEFKNVLQRDIEHIDAFRKKFGKRVNTDVFETRLPNDLLEEGSSKEISELMSHVSENFKLKLGSDITAFYEPNLKGSFHSNVVKTAEALALHNKAQGSALAGFKLRTGGVEASSFPSYEEIAFVIMSCIEYEVPMKCTAGLHHPIRHYDELTECEMHGFLNVFGAGIFAYACDLVEEEIIRILMEDDPYTFYFDDEGLEWADQKMSNAEITNAREKFMLSFGSCSFDEPVDDLKTMELL